MSWERVKLRSVNLNENVRDVVGLLTNLAPLWNDVPAVLLDLTSCGFLNAEGAAILAAFVVHRRTWGGSTGLDWDTASYDLKRQLGRWRLTELFGRENFPWTDNAIPLLHQERLDGPSVIEHISTVIRAGENMPAMTPDLQREINKALCELFVNIFEHAGSACGGLAIGQYYPIKKQVQFCVCDVGVGSGQQGSVGGFWLKLLQRRHSMGFARRQLNEAGPQRTRTLSVAGIRQVKRRLAANSCQYRTLSPKKSAYYSRVSRCFFSRDLDPTRALDPPWRGLYD